MKILISGGTGLVGRSLLGELHNAGHTCTVLSRAPERHGDLPVPVRLRAWDARSTAPLIELMEEAEAVVHLAGESIAAGRWTTTRKRQILASRVDSTRAMTTALQQAQSPPEVFLQASAVGYYGPRESETVTEDTPPGDDFLAQVCKQWESASAVLDSSQIRRVVMRTGIVLSDEGGALPRMVLPFKMFAGGPVGSGRQWMPWIHLQDEVEAIRFLLEHPEARGPFNLTAPNPVTNREFGTALGRVLGRPSLMPTPGIALRLALGEMADLILTGQRAVPDRLVSLGYEFRFPQLEAALREIY